MGLVDVLCARPFLPGDPAEEECCDSDIGLELELVGLRVWHHMSPQVIVLGLAVDHEGRIPRGEVAVQLHMPSVEVSDPDAARGEPRHCG